MAAMTSSSASGSTLYVPPSRGTLLFRYLRRNKGILAGLSILLLLTVFTVHGMITLDPNRAYPLAVRTKQPPAVIDWFCERGILNWCEKAEISAPADISVLGSSGGAAKPAESSKPSSDIGALPGIGGDTPKPSVDIGALPGIGGDTPKPSVDIGALPGIGGDTPKPSGDIGALPGIGGDTAKPTAQPSTSGTAASSTTPKPSAERYLLGTDWYGRDLHTAMVVGLWQTALIGVFAGLIATIVPVILGFLAAYFGGRWDRVITGICSILQPIPPFLIQVVLASSLPRNDLFLDDQPLRTIAIIGIIVSLTAWMKPTLVIRSQVLSMKERMFVNVAKLSGMGSADIIFKELLPNLLPFIVASFVNAIFDALFISFGLSVLGLAPLREPLLGNIIYFAQQQSAIFNGWWWWPLWPVLALIMIFAALTLINTGLDEVANPRARRSE
ncbi:MAG: ABC transporter permease [Anaerolineae bacterium]|nr:ABC transporter permease [Anaerolineae bacterium]